MAEWTVVVEALGKKANEEQKFVIWLFAPSSGGIRGPDGGPDYKGYSEAELRKALVGNYKLAPNAADALIGIAKSRGATFSGD